MNTLLESVKEPEQEQELEKEKQERLILSYNELIKTIPIKNVVLKPNIKLANIYTEWVWKFYNINNRQLIVITKKEPNKEILYMVQNNEWKPFTNEHLYEKYIVLTLYYYAKNN